MWLVTHGQLTVRDPTSHSIHFFSVVEGGPHTRDDLLFLWIVRYRIYEDCGTEISLTVSVTRTPILLYS